MTHVLVHECADAVELGLALPARHQRGSLLGGSATQLDLARERAAVPGLGPHGDLSEQLESRGVLGLLIDKLSQRRIERRTCRPVRLQELVASGDDEPARARLHLDELRDEEVRGEQLSLFRPLLLVRVEGALYPDVNGRAERDADEKEGEVCAEDLVADRERSQPTWQVHRACANRTSRQTLH